MSLEQISPLTENAVESQAEVWDDWTYPKAPLHVGRLPDSQPEARSQEDLVGDKCNRRCQRLRAQSSEIAPSDPNLRMKKVAVGHSISEVCLATDG